MDGAELTEHLRTGCIHFIGGGVLSAVPKGTKEGKINRYTPYWEHADLFTPNYHFQTPLTQLEIICYDGDWLIVCKSSFSERVRRGLPQTQPPEAYFRNSISTAKNS